MIHAAGKGEVLRIARGEIERFVPFGESRQYDDSDDVYTDEQVYAVCPSSVTRFF